MLGKIFQTKKQNGFSLIETIIYVAIFAIFVISMVSFYGTINSSRLKWQEGLEVNYQGTRAIRTITQTIRNAEIIDAPVISSSDDSLTVVSVTSDVTTFHVSNGIIFITEDSKPPVALTNNKVNITNMAFSNYSKPNTPGNVRISFTMSSNHSSASLEEQYSVDFYDSASIR